MSSLTCSKHFRYLDAYLLFQPSPKGSDKNISTMWMDQAKGLPSPEFTLQQPCISECSWDTHKQHVWVLDSSTSPVICCL